jgi:aminopeptidase N
MHTQRESLDDTTSIFDFPGSKIQYELFPTFVIEFMLLKIEPNFISKTLINCEQKLKIKLLYDLKEIKLDIAEMKIDKKDINSSIEIDNVLVEEEKDKLIIQFKKIQEKNTEIELTIKYSPGYYLLKEINSSRMNPPHSGFHFISKSEGQPAFQAWTQGEALESRYWFPCIDDPNMKYPREIQIIVPSDEYIVISNGENDMTEQETLDEEKDGKKKVKWIWKEPNPNTAYVTSVVIGKFSKENVKYDNERISLAYFWPNEIKKEDAMRSFSETPKMMEFFESYYGQRYPYKKYWQVTVDDFEFGGMENTTCTTLTKDILHDEKVLPDYNFDITVVAHELAHQWFGDLVTCQSWSHIWLNEAFASYAEALYFEFSKNKDEFLYKVFQDNNRYLDEANQLYKRPIVTKIYKHPDELFDAHSYRKGASILHILRNTIGDTNFKNSIKEYLHIYKNSNAETDDFRKVCESITGRNLQEFFEQWIYRKGHPVLDIEYSLIEKEKGNSLKIKIKQSQKEEEEKGEFLFPLEIRIVFSNESKDKEPEIIQISKKINEKEILIPEAKSISWISIDPNLKILKEIKSIKIIEEKEENGFLLKNILINQLKNGNTAIERIQAANFLKNHYSNDVVKILEDTIKKDEFYGVSIQAANTLGSYYDKTNLEKSNTSYNSLIQCLSDSNVSLSLIRRAVIRNIGLFERKESIPILLEQMTNKNYYIQANTATALGKSGKNLSNFNKEKDQKKDLIKKLKGIVNGPKTFQNVVASGAIDGLKEFYKDDDVELVIDIANFLIDKTDIRNEYYIRSTATAALGKFLLTSNKKIAKDNEKLSQKIKEMNLNTFDCLLKLLYDDRRRIKVNACSALADIDAKPSTLDPRLIQSIEILSDVAKHDLDGFVRRPAERCANIIREWIKEMTSKPLQLDIKLREKREFITRFDYSQEEKENNEKLLKSIRTLIME